MGILVIAIGTIGFIAAVLTHYWDALAAMPDSIAAFLGALSGAGFGLLAILLGAFYNAELSRQRDDRLRNQEARAIAIALRAELAGVIAEAAGGWATTAKLRGQPGPVRPANLGALEVPPKLVFANNTHHLGDLGDTVAWTVVSAHVITENQRVYIAAARAHTAETVIEDPDLKKFRDGFELVIKHGAEAVNALCDFLGEPQPYPDLESAVESVLAIPRAEARSASEGAGESDIQ